LYVGAVTANIKEVVACGNAWELSSVGDNQQGPSVVRDYAEHFQLKDS